jgi:glycine dehydrogenase subunit 2
MTLEPSESYSRADLDEYADILAEVSREAYEDPERVSSAPHRSTIHQMDPAPHDDPQRWVLTWRAHLRKSRDATGREAALEAQASGS